MDPSARTLRTRLEHGQAHPREVVATLAATALDAPTRAARLDAVFVSCTSLRLAENVALIEAEVGIPVTSSDHAMAWHCLRLAGVNDAVPNAGRLFGCPTPSPHPWSAPRP